MTPASSGDRSALDDVSLAAALAAGAGDVLMAPPPAMRAGPTASPFDGRREDCAAGDAAAQAWLAAALAAARPDDAILSEEAEPTTPAA